MLRPSEEKRGQIPIDNPLCLMQLWKPCEPIPCIGRNEAILKCFHLLLLPHQRTCLSVYYISPPHAFVQPASNHFSPRQLMNWAQLAASRAAAGVRPRGGLPVGWSAVGSSSSVQVGKFSKRRRRMGDL